MTFDWSVIWEYRDDLIRAVWLTIFIAVVVMVIAVPAGIVVALMRMSRLRVMSWAAAVYVEFFRNIPLIMLVYWAYYALPIFLHYRTSALITAIGALACNTAAYNSEIFRAGVNSIRKGQMEAALTLGMTRGQAMRRIILPQAIRRILPILASMWISLFKATSLASVITVGELSYTALMLRFQTFRVLEFITAMAVIYWALGYPQAKLVDWIHRKYGHSE
jgi:polar amino acid transport system permease protein